MTLLVLARPTALSPPRVARAILLAAVFISLAAAVLAGGGAAAGDAELALLLRFMAAVKALVAAGAIAAVFWRLATPAPPPLLAAYVASSAAMAAGPALVWTLAHVAIGALLLHGGLLATIIMLWRDQDVAARLATLVAARRRHANIGGIAPESDLRRIDRISKNYSG
jgi:hypothetical protein